MLLAQLVPLKTTAGSVEELARASLPAYMAGLLETAERDVVIVADPR